MNELDDLRFAESGSGGVFIHAVKNGKTLCGRVPGESWWFRGPDYERDLWDLNPEARCSHCKKALTRKD